MKKLELGLEIIKKINDNSFEAYIVGGAVRDYICKNDIIDVDITTSAGFDDLKNIFSSLEAIGSNYLSCRILYKNEVFEVTTYRIDVLYIDHRHPQAKRATNLKTDLLRRDFTINALAMDYNRDIIDLFNGIDDLKKGIIRTIGEPNKRFNEDGLRVLRALDFASRFNFKLDELIIASFKNDYVGFLKEEYILSMVKRIISNKYSVGLEYIFKYKLLRGFPFYQVLCEEVYKLGYREDSLALFYANHNFIPSNIKLSKIELNEAKDIAYFVRNKFNNVSLYYGNRKVLLRAINLFNALNRTNIGLAAINELINSLPIHSPKDILYTWDNNKNRGKITKILENAILNGEVENEESKLKKYLEIEE